MRYLSQGEIPTRNFFAPLRTTEMEVKHTLVKETIDKPDGKSEQPSSSKSRRSPPIVLTSITKLRQLKRQISHPSDTSRGNKYC
jgi:hypothetical protein